MIRKCSFGGKEKEKTIRVGEKENETKINIRFS